MHSPLQCGAEFKSEQVVRLNVSEEEEKGMREEMEERRRQAKMAKVNAHSESPMRERYSFQFFHWLTDFVETVLMHCHSHYNALHLLCCVLRCVFCPPRERERLWERQKFQARTPPPLLPLK